LIGKGFHLAVAERSPAANDDANAELITHSDRLVLVDGQGRIRAYYHGTEEGAVAQVVRDIARLKQEVR
jgi:cytochrome oxidase Cu insertion factor (SCO1/SenC/PrrC family)